jgi:hypothetical protein
MRFATILLSVSAVVAFAMPQRAIADFTFGEPERVGPVLTGEDMIDCFSSDGLEMYIDTFRSGGQGDLDLWVLKRASKEEDWVSPQNLGPAVNSPKEDSFSSVSADGLTLYFSSNRTGGSGDYDIYMTTRATRNDPWGPAVNLGSQINSSSTDGEPWISPNGLELYFESFRGGYGRSDIYVVKRQTEKDPWGAPVNLGPVVNSAYYESFLSLSPDGLLLLFSDHSNFGTPRPDGYGKADMWMARRTSLSAPWQAPVNLGPVVNSPSVDAAPRISSDGSALHFWGTRSGGYENWRAAIVPIVDLNGDGKVDEQDILMMRAHWGQDFPLCDIGPMPWGDGIVDMEDLRVLMGYTGSTDAGWTDPAMNPVLHALEVPRNVILSWASPNFAEAHDVYFGTSFEDIDMADRGNPLGVLMSRGQTATTYDPDGLLEFGQTYYWRIDEVGGTPDSTIYKGPVLDFTTEAFAYPIDKVIASASSSQLGWGPGNTVNESGLDGSDGHSTIDTDMWLSALAGPQPAWIRYEFDQVFRLHEMWVWNHNLLMEPVIGFGLKDVTVEYSTNGTDWTVLSDVQCARAPGQGSYAHNTTISFDGVAAKYVKLTAKSNWGGLSPQCGLSEVRFLHIPVYPSQPTPTSGQKGVDVDAVLGWRAGREAASHQVLLSTDREAVANGTALIDTVGDSTVDPGPLALGRTYYWRIDGVNEAETPSVWEGDLWSFSTKEYLVLDDFEGYTDKEGSEIFETWVDGWTNGTGSQVGYTQSPFAEQIVVHGGKQSMPLEYNNVDSPWYSQAEQVFSTAQDWTINRADTLKVHFRGNPVGFLLRTDDSIQMSGGGADIWGTSDQFRFAYKQLNGDGSIVARIHSLTATSAWAKAGVMIRGSLDPASAYAFMFQTPDGRRAFQSRGDMGSKAVSAHSDAGAVAFPLWLKVERQGGFLIGFYSQDGRNWIRQPDKENTESNGANPAWITMTDDVCIGLAITSHNISMPAIAEFSDVSFTGAFTSQWQVDAIGAEQPGNNPAPLYVAVEDDAGHVKAVTHPDPTAVQTIEWQQWLIPLSEFTSAGVNLASVKKMSIGTGDPGNPTVGGTGVIYIDDIGVGHPLSSE